MTLDNLRVLLNIADESFESFDLKQMAVISLSIIDLAFKTQESHTDIRLSQCEANYCSNKGRCVPVKADSFWKKCECDPGYTGLTCAMERGEDTKVEAMFEKLIDISERVTLSPANIGDITEVLKSIASVRHVFSMSLVTRISSLLPKVIEALGEQALDKEIVEDLFIIVENLKIALQSDFYSNEGLKPDIAYNKVLVLEEKIGFLLDLILVQKKRKFVRFAMEHCGINVLTNRPSEDDGVEFETVIVEQSRENEQLPQDEESESRPMTIVMVPKSTLKKLTLAGDEVALIAWEREYNPYIVGMGNETEVVSSVLSLRAKDPKNIAAGDIKVEDQDGAVTIVFTKAKDKLINWREVECAWFDTEAKNFTTRDCATTLPSDDTSGVVCTCSHLTDFALVIQRGQKPTPIDDDEDDIIPGPLPPPLPEAGIKWRFVGLTIFIILTLWFAYFRSSKREGINNSSFNESLTAHPIYSIININQGRLPKTVRLHLFALTLTLQLYSDVVLADRYPELAKFEIGMLGVAISLFGNYVFGLIAHLVARYDRPQGKPMFNAFAEFLIILALVLANIQLAAHQTFSLSTVLWPFALGLFVDLLILDPAIVLLTQFDLVRNWISLRGFYNEVNLPAGNFVSYP
eukprot:TRINITY_DN6165_c0_g3_i2.p1 TRINITY_DN6165_c0_g3~~TRINITY_DN6165_c0_g3_i2.p1  ORF type:complete len:633 (+),score=164.70 TRINITY_DN6165_c0_g3_i2:167-2065(+)